MTILISDLTTKMIGGEGVFDELMSAITVRIDKEYNKGAITGADYAKVYLGAMQSVLSESVAFLLAKDRTNAEVALQAAQLALAEQELVNSKLQETILTHKAAEAEQSALLSIEKVAEAKIDVINKDKQTTVLTNQALNIAADTAKTVEETTNANKRGALIDKEVLLATEKILETTQSVANLAATKLKIEADTSMTNQQRTNAVTQGTVLSRQADKILAEKDLLAQKKVSETAQTETGSTSGVIGAQIALYSKQKDGFDRDAEQKAAQIYKDIWVVQRSTDKGLVPNSVNKTTDADMGVVMAKLATGVTA